MAKAAAAPARKRTPPANAPRALLLPYQQRWVNDKSRHKIADKGRQIGLSWATMLEVVDDCMDAAGGDWAVLSAGERQAKKLCKTLIGWVRAYDAALESIVRAESGALWTEKDFWCESIAEKVTVLEVTFRNGKTVSFLPANPDTARGWSCNVVLDEFAFHKDGMEILKAVGPSTLRGGYRLIIISTPNGKNGAFYEIWTNAANDYSKHFIPLSAAIAEGLAVDYQAMCDLLNNDPDAIAQELEGSFLDSAAQFLSPELIAFAETDKAAAPIRFEGWTGPGDERQGRLLSETAGKPRIVGDLFAADYAEIERLVGETDGELFVGFDVARTRDLTVLNLNRRVASEHLNCELPALTVELSHVSFDSQEAIARLMLKRARRGAIDATGIGKQIAENMRREFGEGKVEEIVFANEIKSELAWRVRNKLQDTTAKIPAGNASVRAALKSIRKTKTSTGADRFDADRTAEAAHADYFWAYALSLHAAAQPIARVGYIPVVTRALGSFFRGRGKADDKRFPPRDEPRRPSRWAGF